MQKKEKQKSTTKIDRKKSSANEILKSSKKGNIKTTLKESTEKKKETKEKKLIGKEVVINKEELTEEKINQVIITDIKPDIKPKTNNKIQDSGKNMEKIENKEKRAPERTAYSKEELEYFKNLILEKKKITLEQLETLQEQLKETSDSEYINENSPYSLHMAEQGTDAMEREKLYLWVQREIKFLGYLDEALKRIENGTYGICVECIDEPKFLCPTCPLIPKERLEVVPHTQMCVQVKLLKEKSK